MWRYFRVCRLVFGLGGAAASAKDEGGCLLSLSDFLIGRLIASMASILTAAPRRSPWRRLKCALTGLPEYLPDELGHVICELRLLNDSGTAVHEGVKIWDQVYAVES